MWLTNKYLVVCQGMYPEVEAESKTRRQVALFPSGSHGFINRLKGFLGKESYLKIPWNSLGYLGGLPRRFANCLQDYIGPKTEVVMS